MSLHPKTKASACRAVLTETGKCPLLLGRRSITDHVREFCICAVQNDCIIHVNMVKQRLGQGIGNGARQGMQAPPCYLADLQLQLDVHLAISQHPVTGCLKNSWGVQ